MGEHKFKDTRHQCISNIRLNSLAIENLEGEIQFQKALEISMYDSKISDTNVSTVEH